MQRDDATGPCGHLAGVVSHHLHGEAGRRVAVEVRGRECAAALWVATGGKVIFLQAGLLNLIFIIIEKSEGFRVFLFSAICQWYNTVKHNLIN